MLLVNLRHSYFRACGGIGRHAILRGWCLYKRGGSNPPLRTLWTSLRVISSVGLERPVDIGEVAGSNPVSLTQVLGFCSLLEIRHAYLYTATILSLRKADKANDLCTITSFSTKCIIFLY